jgi:hypothetical protein
MTDEEILAQRAVIYMSHTVVRQRGKRFLQVVLFGRPEEILVPDDDEEEDQPGK